MLINDVSTLLLLIGLELVLGIDNVLMISILVSRLPKLEQTKVRNLGLLLAMGCRLLMLLGASYLARATEPLFYSFSARDMLLFFGGLFLLYKAVSEIHKTVELKHKHSELTPSGSILLQIIVLDIVFSFDSVLTAVGMTSHLWVIFASVVISFLIILLYAKKIGDFMLENPALKILALSFLVTIGVTLFLESMHHEIPKAYIYLPMGFALLVELLQMRFNRNLSKNEKD